MKEKEDMSPVDAGMLIGTAVEFQDVILNLIAEYNQKGIEEIPISVLIQALVESSVKTAGFGLLDKMLKKGDTNEII